jgi:hypothetical protein
LILFLSALVLLVGGLIGAGIYLAGQFSGGLKDFAPGWMGAYFWLQKGVSPYNIQVSEDAWKLVFTGTSGRLPFTYPLYALFFFGPFSLADYPLARGLWLAFIEGGMIGLAGLSLALSGWKMDWRGTGLILLFAAGWYVSLRAAFAGQLTPITAIFLVLALWMASRGQDGSAGLFLALATIDISRSLLTVIFLLFWAGFGGKRRLLGSFAAVLAFLWVVTVVLQLDWPWHWLQTLFGSFNLSSGYGSVLSNAAGVVPGLQGQVSAAAHGAILLYLAAEWVRAFRWAKTSQGPQSHGSLRRPDSLFLWTAMMTLVVTCVSAYHFVLGDLALLLPVFLLVFGAWQERWAGGRVVGWGLLAVMLVIPWLSAVQAYRTGQAEAGYQAVLLPLLAFLGLWWVRWWMARPPLLPFDMLRERSGL